MKHFSLIKSTLILTLFLSIFCLSCNNEIQNNEYNNIIDSKENLLTYAKIHNLGLDSIKYDIQRTQTKYTEKNLNHVLEKYVNHVYGKSNSPKIMKDIVPKEKLIFNNIPSLTQINNNQSTKISIIALNDCMNKIKDRLKNFKDDEIFDNIFLLEELHTIIYETYKIYIIKCNSNIEKQNLTQSLGVLYGSIEYWMNSDNVKFWSRIEMEKTNSYNKIEIKKDPKPQKPQKHQNHKEKKKPDSDNRKLPPKDYIEVISAADATGALIGVGAGSGPLAIIASAAAAAYFDVKR